MPNVRVKVSMVRVRVSMVRVGLIGLGLDGLLRVRKLSRVKVMVSRIMVSVRVSFGWLRGTVVRTLVFDRRTFLSHARLAADG